MLTAVAFAVVGALAGCGANKIGQKDSGSMQRIGAMRPAGMAGQPTGAMDAAIGDSGTLTKAPDAGKPTKATDAGKPATTTDAGLADAQASAALALELTNVDVTNDTKRRFGAPHVAVNPKNPDNIVVLASSSLGYTRACVPAPPGSDCEMIAAGSPLLTQPRGGMALDSHGGAYVVWADWTPGERSIFFSAINVNAFEL